MKKKLILIFLFCLFSLSAFADTENSSVQKDWGENSSVFSKGFEGQEPVSDKKLKDTIEALKQRNLTKKQKKMQNLVKPLSPSSDFENLKQFALEQDPDNQLSQTLTVTISTSAYNENGKKIPPGFYKLSCRKLSDNSYVLDLSQGTKRVLSVKAEQTQQDLEQDSIQFCNAEIIDSNRIRLVYGSIDLNLVGYLYFK